MKNFKLLPILTVAICGTAFFSMNSALASLQNCSTPSACAAPLKNMFNNEVKGSPACQQVVFEPAPNNQTLVQGETTCYANAMLQPTMGGVSWHFRPVYQMGKNKINFIIISRDAILRGKSQTPNLTVSLDCGGYHHTDKNGPHHWVAQGSGFVCFYHPKH